MQSRHESRQSQKSHNHTNKNMGFMVHIKKFFNFFVAEVFGRRQDNKFENYKHDDI